MNRRGFLGAILAAGAAPAIVKAENLMKIFVPPEKKIFTLSGLAADFDGDVLSIADTYPTSMASYNQYFDAMQRRLYRNATVGARMTPPTNMPTSMDALFQQMKQDRLIIKEFRKQQFNLQ